MANDNLRQTGQKELKRIIDFCISVEENNLNPFSVEVSDLISIIKEYFPNWENEEDLCLDSQALNRIASIIKKQSEWINYRAKSLYRDPFLITDKLRNLEVQKIAKIFLDSWNPIVEIEQITIPSLNAAIEYWRNLTPLSERWPDKDILDFNNSLTTRENLIKEKILLDETFSSELEKLWSILKKKVTESKKIHYKDFINSETYRETIRKAYLTSFLITYGYASLEVNPLEDEIFIRPLEKPFLVENKELFSFPITLSKKEWAKWHKKPKE